MHGTQLVFYLASESPVLNFTTRPHPLSFPLHQDVPLISLANIFQNARLWEDALTVARMAVEIAPHFVVNHFTLANVYITMVAASLSVLNLKVLTHRERADAIDYMQILLFRKLF